MKTEIGVIPKVILESPGAESAFSSFVQVLRIARLGLRIIPCASQSRYRARDHLQVIAEPSRTLYRTAVSVFGVVAIKVIRVSDLDRPSQSLTLAQTAMQSPRSIPDLCESRAVDSFDRCGSSLESSPSRAESPEHWSIGI